MIGSGFMKGPWGPKTLCVVHYVAWFRNKKLDLSAYVRLYFELNSFSCLIYLISKSNMSYIA